MYGQTEPQILSRLASYSLGNLIKHFDIEVNARHRALDDALAAAELFRYIWKDTGSYESIRQILDEALHLTRYPESISREKLDELPEECGLYYMYNEAGETIYIGKSKNIRKRIKQHFSKNGKKAALMREKTHDLDWKITGSELLALLAESEEIKTTQPEINRAQKNRSYPFALKLQETPDGYRYLKVCKRVFKNENSESRVVNTYRTEKAALGHVDSVLEELELCPCIGRDEEGKRCFRRQLKICCGAGSRDCPAEEYNQRLEEAVEQLDNYFHKDFLIVEEGPEPGNRVIFGIKDGSYRGYVILEGNDSVGSPEALFELLESKSTNKEVQRIIYHYLQSKKELEIIELPSGDRR